MQIIWNQTPRERWDAEHARHSTVMQQHWVYGASMRLPGMQTHRAEVVLNGRSVALAQFICRRYAGIFGIALCTRGPIWLGDVADADKARIQRALKQSLPMARPRIILFSPDLTDPRHPSMASLTRVLTGYSTVMLDLSQPLSALRAGLHPYWRNRLSAAERSGLKLAVLSHDSAELPRILAEEQIQRQRKRFYALPLGFIDHYLEEGGTESALILQASWQSRPVAVMLFLIHGSSATYQLGWSQAQGRALNAHNLILWNAIEQLKQRGIDKLDLGGVNTHDLPGISRFKINTGGEVITYAGGYV
ncbi:MAG: lipid II:glycine glycyltransferase FemX [Burkholderiaceae bacterium]